MANNNIIIGINDNNQPDQYINVSQLKKIVINIIHNVMAIISVILISIDSVNDSIESQYSVSKADVFNEMTNNLSVA